MPVPIGRKASDAVGTSVVVLLYIAYFWRTFRSNHGNRFIECGTITLIAFFVMVPVSIYLRPPNWLISLWVILLVIHCFTTLFFLLLRAIRAGIRADQHPKKK